jgi:hypothetical protein
LPLKKKQHCWREMRSSCVVAVGKQNKE